MHTDLARRKSERPPCVLLLTDAAPEAPDELVLELVPIPTDNAEDSTDACDMPLGLPKHAGSVTLERTVSPRLGSKRSA